MAPGIVTLFQLPVNLEKHAILPCDRAILRYLRKEASGTGWMLRWHHYKTSTEVHLMWGEKGVIEAVEDGVADVIQGYFNLELEFERKTTTELLAELGL